MVVMQTTLLCSLIILCEVASSASESSDIDDDLIFVQVVSRNGARSPFLVYPTDPYKKEWKDGLGQLTEFGVRQTEELGRYLRQRYVDGDPFKFLSRSFDRREIYVRSSDLDRTIVSAASCMNGLYPTDDSRVNMVAVHTVPQSQDGILLSVNCSSYEKVLQEVMLEPEIESTRLAHVDFLQHLAKNTRMKIKSFDSVLSIVDNLNSILAHNLSLPEWTRHMKYNKTFATIVSSLGEFYLNARYNKRNEARLISGALLKHLVDNMSEKINGNSTAPHERNKAKFYFTHENIMAALLGTMDLFNGRSPPYASSIFFELYGQIIAGGSDSNISGNFAVKILFRNSSVDSPHVLQIAGCREKCPLERFIELTRKNFVSDPKEECLPSVDNELKERDYLVLGLGTACVFCLVVALGSTLFAFVSHRSTRVYRKYVDVPTEVE